MPALVTVLSARLATAEGPSLVLGTCTGPGVSAGERQCVPVLLATNGYPVASMAFSLIYPTDSLRILDWSTDVERGAAIGVHGMSVAVAEVPEALVGQLRVSIIPPPALPVPRVADGELVRVCFTVPADPIPGCAAVQFDGGRADFGDDQGRDITPVGSLVAGGVQVSAPTTTTTTTLRPTVTTTTVPCATASCLAASALSDPACAGLIIPAPLSDRLQQAAALAAQAAETTGRAQRRLQKRARHELTVANRKAKRLSQGKHPKLAPACAAAVQSAIRLANGALAAGQF